MKFLSRYQWFAWLLSLNHQVQILAFGRFLSEIGTGFTLFYAPIFFVNQVGLSATEVGLALGSASISGIAGRILGGSFSDAQFWGRRRTLLLASAVSAVSSLVLAVTASFPVLVVGNLLSGFGVGLYWPATEAVVADLTYGEQRHEAYAITRLADNLGLGIGIILGGALVGTTGAYRLLFVIDAISFAVFFGVVYVAIAETLQPLTTQSNTPPQATEPRWFGLSRNWAVALRDRRLLIYALVNVVFTTYVSQLHSTLPLYFSQFVGKGFSALTISALFSWQMILSILCFIPISRILRRFSHSQALTISALLWAVGFFLIWVTGVSPNVQLGWAILSMGVFAIASVTYTPSASSLVADLAPDSLRGVYMSINSLCWAVGYFIGPPLGGWALDQPRTFVYTFWLGLAVSVLMPMGILQYLNRILKK